jgi:SAM-dependent methyltransferase
VLDIGAGAGRHSLYLQRLGYIVHSIDISPLAVEVMLQRGIRNAYKMDLHKLNYPNNFFDTYLMMFNNFGLAGTMKETKKLLNKLNRMASPKGRIITSIRNPYWTENPNYLAYQKRNEEKGRPAGQLKLRLKYKEEISDWFDLLIVSPGELMDLIKGTGWAIKMYITHKAEGVYGIVLIKQ